VPNAVPALNERGILPGSLPAIIPAVPLQLLKSPDPVLAVPEAATRVAPPHCSLTFNLKKL
jgi:hypothetical protein